MSINLLLLGYFAENRRPGKTAKYPHIAAKSSGENARTVMIKQYMLNASGLIGQSFHIFFRKSVLHLAVASHEAAKRQIAGAVDIMEN